MSGHGRDLLPLAASGVLEPDEAERLGAHLRECAACAAEAAAWQELAGGLGRIPAPEPSTALVARTRRAAEALVAEHAERRWRHAALGIAVLVAWMATAATWLLVSAVASELARRLGTPVGPATVWYGTYLLAGTLAAGAAATLLGRRARREGRMA